MENKKEMSGWLNDFRIGSSIGNYGAMQCTETEEQVLKIAHQLKDTDVTIYRAEFGNLEQDLGCSKVLNIGLDWLKGQGTNRTIDLN